MSLIRRLTLSLSPALLASTLAVTSITTITTAGGASYAAEPGASASEASAAWAGQGASLTSTERLDSTFANPVTGTDTPDVSTIRVSAADAGEPRDVYYMISTTMELSPGAPVLKSYDLVNWEIASYVWGALETNDGSALRNGKSSYGQGQWASTIAFHDGTYYVIFNSNNNNHSYLFTTDDIENGSWTRHAYTQGFHDPSLYFEGDTPYVFYGSTRTDALRLSPDLKTVEQTYPNVITKENFTNESGLTRDEVAPSGWEGFQIYRVGDWYYALAITFGKYGRQTVIFRSRSLLGAAAATPDPYAGKVAVGTKSIAQGGFVATTAGAAPDYAMLFADDFPTGRVPVLVPVSWPADPQGWPTFGNGNVGGADQVAYPGDLAMPVQLDDATRRLALSASMVASDDFANDASPRRWSYPASTLPATTPEAEAEAQAEIADNGSYLAKPWQWNHNPDNRYWSLTDRPGWLRLTNGHVVTGTATSQFNLTKFEEARNTLSQRTVAPTSSAETRMDVSRMKDGDTAGLAVYNRQVSFIAVRMVDGVKTLGVVNRKTTGFAKTDPIADGETFIAQTALPAGATQVSVKADFDMRRPAADSPTRNTVQFLYSLDGTTWQKLGGANPKLAGFEGSHFKGQRFGLFSYAEKSTGGSVDFDYYDLSDVLTSDGRPIDRSDLDWLIAEADALDPSSYDAASWAPVAAALATARALTAPSTQNQVDAPARDLNAAVARLLAEPQPTPGTPTLPTGTNPTTVPVGTLPSQPATSPTSLRIRRIGQARAGARMRIAVRVTSTSGSVGSGRVRLRISGIGVPPVTATVRRGKAVLHLRVPRSARPGSGKATATYFGGSSYARSRSTRPVRIVR